MRVFFYILKVVGALLGLGLLVALLIYKSLDSPLFKAICIGFAATLLILEKMLKGIAFDMEAERRLSAKRILDEWSHVFGVFAAALGAPAVAATIIALD